MAIGTIFTVFESNQSQGVHCHSNTELLLDFLLKSPQKNTVRGGRVNSGFNSLNTGIPQGFVLSPLLFTLMTREYSPRFINNHICMYVDSTAVGGLAGRNIYCKGVGWTTWSWKSTRQRRCRKKITAVFFCNQNNKTKSYSVHGILICLCNYLYFFLLFIQFEKKLDPSPLPTSFKMLLHSPKPAQVTPPYFSFCYKFQLLCLRIIQPFHPSPPTHPWTPSRKDNKANPPADCTWWEWPRWPLHSGWPQGSGGTFQP